MKELRTLLKKGAILVSILQRNRTHRIHIKRFILRDWLMALWGLASLQPIIHVGV